MLAVFRADGGSEIGGGHIARCGSLANALRRKGWRTALATSSKSLESLGMEGADFDETLNLASDEADAIENRWPDGCDVLVVDHYRRDAHLEYSLRPWANYIVAIDDLADRTHHCDLLIDPTPGRRADDYGAYLLKNSRLLLGPEYALLRSEFCTERSLARQRYFDGDRLRLLILFGATDYAAQSPMVAEALSHSGLPIELDIVVGSTASTIGRLQQIAADSTIPMTVTVNAPNIASHMARADLAVGGAGTTSWERCCLGLPAIVIVVVANQIRNADELAARGAAITVGSAGAVSGEQVVTQVAALIGDRDRLYDMSRKAAALCDGRGVERVTSEICGGLVHGL